MYDNISAKAKFKKKYPQVTEGDMVKLIRKPGKYGEFKEGFVAYTEKTYKVTKVTLINAQTVYFVEGMKNPLLRHELLKVDDVQQPPHKGVREKKDPQHHVRT